MTYIIKQGAMSLKYAKEHIFYDIILTSKDY